MMDHFTIPALPITKVTVQDIPELESLINNAYRGESSLKGWTTEAYLLDGIRTDAQSLQAMLNKENAVILKYNDKDRAIQGCVYLEKRGGKMYLGLLTVAPMEQSKGIGKQLLQASEQYANDQECTVMEISVISVRKELIAWYEKWGYHLTGESKPFPDDVKFGIPRQPLEFVLMEKNI